MPLKRLSPHRFLRRTGRNKKSTVLVTIFSIITVVSVISIVLSTLNYTEFYKAIREIKIAGANVDAVVNGEELNITLTFKIVNPTGYTGLKLRQVTCQLYYEDDGVLVPVWWTIESTHEMPLGPNSETPFEWNSTVLGSAQQFKEYYESHQGAIEWELKCGIILVTFLGNIDRSFTENFSQ